MSRARPRPIDEDDVTNERRICDPGAYYLGTPARYWITKADLADLVSSTPGGYMW